MAIIGPDYSDNEFSDFEDEFGYDFMPRSKSSAQFIPTPKDYKTQLYESVIYGTFNEFVELLENNSNKVDFEYDGWTLLMVAGSYGQYKKMEYLLQVGLDPNYNYNLFTPLLAVCDSSKQPEEDLVPCIILLEKYGAHFNIEDRHGMTPLMYACKNGHLKITKYLINKCPDSINKTDKESQSALFFAVLHNRANIVELLIEANAETNMYDLHGRKPVDIAIVKQTHNIVELLQPGHIAQQQQEHPAMHQQKSSFPTYDFITLFKANLPDSSNIEETGFYTNVIEMLNACYLLDFSSTIFDNQTSLFQLINSTNESLINNGTHLSYHRNEILKSMKLFNLHQWKPSCSFVPKSDSNDFKTDELIYYVYLVCEQLYINYCAFKYVEQYNFQPKDFRKLCNGDFLETLSQISILISKYDRYTEKEILKRSCVHVSGYINHSFGSNWVRNALKCLVPGIGLGLLYYNFKKQY